MREILVGDFIGLIQPPTDSVGGWKTPPQPPTKYDLEISLFSTIPLVSLFKLSDFLYVFCGRILLPLKMDTKFVADFPSLENRLQKTYGFHDRVVAPTVGARRFFGHIYPTLGIDTMAHSLLL